MTRNDGRFFDQLRPVDLFPKYLPLHPTSCLIKMGLTWVLCAASVEEKVPPFLIGKEQGWVTAEYSMMPASSKQRTQRERQNSGRSQEISRLIGRALRGAVDLSKLGQRTIIVDCDVLQADGGTRTASITGGYVALVLAVQELMEKGLIDQNPLGSAVAAVSAGIVAGQPMLDLDYSEDSHADADLNVVMNEAGEMVEVQGTAEGRAFGEAALQEMLFLARKGIGELLEAQRRVLGM
ncbi:MAG: ribonuclease PH [Chloroflexota bacterium]|jgi:ribonuclease PH